MIRLQTVYSYWVFACHVISLCIHEKLYDDETVRMRQTVTKGDGDM